MRAAIHFQSDAFVLEGKQVMGRRAAGAAFLRAAVDNAGSDPIVAYADDRAGADAFIAAVRRLDAAARPQWIPKDRLDLLAQLGTLYRPDPIIGPEARLRLRAGPAQYSLCGVTHTLLSSGMLDAIGSLLSEPVMPWDALICTSTVARDVISATFDSAGDYLRWRTGAVTPLRRPQLPVIPLGVHCRDWTPSDAARAEARRRLVIDPDEVVLLFAGRLAFASKAHPFQMYEALATVAKATGRKLTILLAGQFFNSHIEAQFRADAAAICPEVRLLHVDGDDAGAYSAGYAAADIFLSLADNYQETFGITPLEAMAAGLPVVVSDWNGYRDTVRNGIDGFRITSWAPAAVAGIARQYEIVGDYDLYSSQTSTLVSVDQKQLVDRLTMLIRDPDLRRQMGEAGRARAAQDFDWRVIYPRYRELWAELAERRVGAVGDTDLQAWIAAAPPAHFAHGDPFHHFVSYPTRAVSPATIVSAVPGADIARYRALTARPSLSLWRIAPEQVEEILGSLADGPLAVEQIALRTGQPGEATIEHVARLAKMNLVTLKPAI